MTTKKLDIWLSGKHLGEIERLRSGALRLRFANEALQRHGVGSRVLSLALPLTTKRVEGPSLVGFLEGLLPESSLRADIERQHRINPGDVLSLLSIIGHECAGAVQFVAPGVEPGRGHLRALSTSEVNALVRDLPTLTPPDGLPVSASLGGVQAKVLLARTETGWAWPSNGAQSTHIVKPEPSTDVLVADLIIMEDWALRLASAIGLPAAKSELHDFDGREAIVVERYDRQHGTRVHQEDFTQALGIAAVNKYETSLAVPTRLQTLAATAAHTSPNPSAFRKTLLQLVTFNVAIGNGDAHSKNYSLTIDAEGQQRLAPLYDCAPVFVANSNFFHSGHAIDGQTNLKYITGEHLVAEAESWGMGKAIAHSIVTETMAAVASTAGDLPVRETLAELPALVAAHARKTLSAARSPHIII